MKQGKFIGVGVGPGDPEYLTLKAARIIKESKVIAVPGQPDKPSAAYRIAVEAVPELIDDIDNNRKQLLYLPMPMKLDREMLAAQHRKNAEAVAEYLKTGDDVVFLTLGDPDIYSTFSYLRDIVKEMGYEVGTIAGIMSISAAAARLNISLADWEESVRILPEGQMDTFDLSEDMTYVMMKPRGSLDPLKQAIASSGKSVYAVTDCGMDSEKVYYDIEEIPDSVGYFTIIIIK